jgi:hypothetical protein
VTRLVPNRWSEFQHYKDRNPPWIRLHRKLLDDRDFQRLPLASRALAPMLWLLASESKDGSFEGSVEELVFRLRQKESEIDAGLKPLIEKGFFVPVQVASSALADGEQVAPKSCSETEGETEADQRQKEPTVLVGSAAEQKQTYKVPNCPHDEIVKAYATALPNLPQVAVLSDVRKSHITARWKAVCADMKLGKDGGVEWFRDFFALVAKSAFLTGSGKPNRDTGRVWSADFDWLMNPQNFVKVVEGRYQDRRAA